ncbi:MAG: hypothetical protein N4A59_05990 [Marinifilum sp.]|jgi:hypothetical protein|nr:hypothetical protein [Marinifilum sp.]
MKFTVTITFLLFLALPGIGQKIDSTVNAFCDKQKLFEDDELFEICLKGNIRKLFKNRNSKSIYHPIQLSYQEKDTIIHHFNIRVKTRGNFRKLRENCSTPPLLLNFDTLSHLENTFFSGQNKLKLVTACTDEQYVLQEYLAYKIYQLITPKSFRVRLVKICFEDSEKGKKTKPEFGILLEHQDCMAHRNKSRLVKWPNLNPIKTNREMFLKMAVFQFLIGNTDWSVQYGHNIKLISGLNNASIIPVPYDFDMSGIVNTGYAAPPEALELKSVRERRYRGYCIKDMNEFSSTFKLYNELKSKIYDLYQSNSYLDTSHKKRTLRFLDEFYEVINNPKLAKLAFQYPCRTKTKLVIKGMKKQ